MVGVRLRRFLYGVLTNFSERALFMASEGEEEEEEEEEEEGAQEEEGEVGEAKGDW